MESEETKFKKLLNEMQLGDRRPSQLLREMKTLATNRVTDDFLKTLWLQRLPQQAQMILSASADDLSRLSVMADRICEVASSAPIINCISPEVKDISDDQNQLIELKSQITELSIAIEELRHQRGRTQFQKFIKGRNFARSKSRDNRRFCWYHTNFGAAAHRCQQPCSYKSQEN
ncbi:hypothetical protein RI129_002951 [Pyrocoelia pectoralis]|uniref:Uncharacterized protein n=1 Tax=Pyrocoelia pectoralis TaxID=417401 RepID=A0AAN7VPT1_9COLE